MRKKQLQKELDEAIRRIADLETRYWIYEGIIQASGFDCCIIQKEKPEMRFIGREKDA